MISSPTIGLICAGCIFGGALLGLLLQGLLPEHHLRDTSKDTVKVAAGMIATLSALVLGLLVGSAKSSFDATNTAITKTAQKSSCWVSREISVRDCAAVTCRPRLSRGSPHRLPKLGIAGFETVVFLLPIFLLGARFF